MDLLATKDLPASGVTAAGIPVSATVINTGTVSPVPQVAHTKS
jgi:hypothetical protein